MIIEGNGDEVGGELQQRGTSVRLSLRHQHEGFTVAAGDLDDVILSLSEHFSRALAQL